MPTLTRAQEEKLARLLAERLAAERLAVRLYEAAAAKAEDPRAAASGELQALVRLHLALELEHVSFLEGRMRALGLDPAAPEERELESELAQRGLFDLILRAQEPLARTLPALLGAGMLDHAGWHALVVFANETGDVEARDAFRRRLWEEHEHLERLRAIVSAGRVRREAA